MVTTITETQKHTPEFEALQHPGKLVDDYGERGEIDITDDVIERLEARGLLLYCGYCSHIRIHEMGDPAREYHPYGAHHFKCLAVSGIAITGIDEMLIDADEPCDMCVAIAKARGEPS